MSLLTRLSNLEPFVPTLRTLSMSAVAALLLGTPLPAHAQTATFTNVTDAVPGRCYDPATTSPDPANANRLIIGIHTGIVPGTFGTSAGCVATDNGPTLTTDTLVFVVNAPDGFYVSKVTFTQTLSTTGSRRGRGFASANWVVAGDARPAVGAAVADLTGQNRTIVPVSITTYLAGAGGSVRSGSATASNPSVLVELAPLIGPPPPPPVPPPNPAPSLSAISPSVVTAGGGPFTLTISGSNFVTGSIVRWNGTDRPTTPVTASQLRATIGATDIAAHGTATVTVFTPGTAPYDFRDGGESADRTITINPAPAPNPVPTITALEPASAIVGTGPLTLTVTGSQFIPGAVVRWNGQARSTVYVSANRVTATLGVLDLFAQGTATVTVFNPATGFNPPPDGGVSNGLGFTISPVPMAEPPAPGPTPSLVNGNVHDGRGREWRQLTQTVGLTRAQLALACPASGPTPYLCSGTIGAIDLTDWVWASTSDVFGLFSYFTTGVNPARPSIGGPQYVPPASQFQQLFALTQSASGCPTYQGCFDFRSVAGLTSTADGNGQATGGSVVLSLNQFGSFDGSFSVGSIADDGSSARGVFLWRPTGLIGGTVHAYGDEGQSPSPFGGTAVNVMRNDWVGGAPATTANASVTPASPFSPPTDRLSLSPDGSVQVAAGALAGTYTFAYHLCTLSAPIACDDATVRIVVRSYTLVATNDSASAPFGTGGSPLNVLTNDTLNAQAVTPAVVTLRQLSSSHAGVSLDVSSGAVNVQAGTPSVAQSLVYEVCERANPTNCRQATVTLTARSILAVNDVFPKISKNGGTSPSVLANDRFNGLVATTATVQLSLVTAPPAGVTLDLSTGRFVVAPGTSSGDYSVTYRICEIGNPTNCSSASAALDISGGV